jgi:hypothetical protein
MRFLTVAVFIASLLGSRVQAQEAGIVTKAEVAAKQWLALIDSGNYAASWEQAAGTFKAGFSKEIWMKIIPDRAPVGAAKSRKLKFAEFATSLPGTPEGKYVVIQYDTQFENWLSAIETVTLLKEKDGSWRVSDYFIK